MRWERKCKRFKKERGWERWEEGEWKERRGEKKGRNMKTRERCREEQRYGRKREWGKVQ